MESIAKNTNKIGINAYRNFRKESVSGEGIEAVYRDGANLHTFHQPDLNNPFFPDFNHVFGMHQVDQSYRIIRSD